MGGSGVAEPSQTKHQLRFEIETKKKTGTETEKGMGKDTGTDSETDTRGGRFYYRDL